MSSFFTRIMDGLRIEDDGSDDDEFYDEPDEDIEPRKTYRQDRKVTPMRQQSRRASSSAGMEVVVVKPNSVDDSRLIIDLLLENKIVNLNLEGLDVSISQRIIDSSMGATYAIRGNLKKISSFIFLLTPHEVDVSGDVPDYQEGGAVNAPVTKTF